jgi:hypothetical protein
LSALLDLAARVEALSGPDRAVDAEIQRLLGSGSGEHWFADMNGAWVKDEFAPDYTSSIDAAMTLLPEGWRIEQIGEWYDAPLRAKGPWLAIIYRPQFRISDGGTGGGGDPFARCENTATPAIALTAAALRAKAGQP